MPRQITERWTYDQMEDEVLFTRGALGADPDARELRGLTDTWLARIATARAADLTARVAEQEASAARAVADQRLDRAVVAFADDLERSVGGDTKSARYTRFFPHGRVSAFLRIALDDEAARVLAWLPVEEPALAAHRVELERWATAAKAATAQSNASAQVRGAAIVQREQLAEELTRGRDGLASALSVMAVERNLGRTWAAGFFRVSRAERKSEPKAEPTT